MTAFEVVGRESRKGLPTEVLPLLSSWKKPVLLLLKNSLEPKCLLFANTSLKSTQKMAQKELVYSSLLPSDPLLKGVEEFTAVANPHSLLLPKSLTPEGVEGNSEWSERGDYWLWANPHYTFYTYKISSPTSPSYYIGRSALKKNAATEEECLEDGYWGSGGRAFKEWKASLGKEELVKEVLSLYNTWEEVVQGEVEAIGEHYRSDPRCLNRHPGGVGAAAYPWRAHFEEDFCEVHGFTKFFGKTCCACRNQKLVTLQHCALHGEVKHQGGKCCKCTSSKTIKEQVCELHGFTKFIGAHCFKCVGGATWTNGECSLHGSVKLRAGVCFKCVSAKSFSVKECEVHGETLFRGALCYRCHAASAKNEGECSIHGLTTFQGSVCRKCVSTTKDHEAYCSIHGVTGFQFATCKKCLAEKRDTLKECLKHGVVKFRGATCSTCTIEKANQVKECPTHGATKFRGKTCCKCSSEKAVHTRYHGNEATKVPVCRWCEEEV